MRSISVCTAILSLLASTPVFAEDDQEGCKDYPLFTRFPKMYIDNCKSSQFERRKFPVGPPKNEKVTKYIEVEGPTYWIDYNQNEGATKVSGLQVMRNFENAAKKAGGTVGGQYPGFRQIEYDDELMPDMGPT